MSILDKAIEVVPDQVYFLPCKIKPQETPEAKIINFDSWFKYEGYNSDFGPYNIGHVTNYCREM